MMTLPYYRPRLKSRRLKLPRRSGWARRVGSGGLPALASILAVLVLACSGGSGEIVEPEQPVATAQATEIVAAAPQIPALPESTLAAPSGIAPIELAVQGRVAFAALDGAIWVTDSEDGSLLQLSPPDEVTGVTGHYAWPGWSPDSSQVSFTSLVPVGPDAIEITLMRADSRGDQVPIKIHLDDPASAGIAPGVPHYAGWAPNTASIVLVTASSDGPEVVLRESQTGSFSQLLARGGPSYISWAPDSRHLLIHRAQSLFMVTISEGAAGRPSMKSARSALSHIVRRSGRHRETHTFSSVVNPARRSYCWAVWAPARHGRLAGRQITWRFRGLRTGPGWEFSREAPLSSKL